MLKRLLPATVLMTCLALCGQAEAQCVLTIDMRLGAIDGECALTAITGVLLSHDRRAVYVTQPGDRQVRVFAAQDGRPIRTIGRRGGGPGEFQAVSRLSWRADTLVIADKVQQRLELFSPGGDHLRSMSFPPVAPEGGGRAAVAIAMDPSGAAWAEPLVNMMSVASGATRATPIVRVSGSGVVLDRVAEVSLRNTMAAATHGGGVSVFSQPLSQTTLRQFAPDGRSVVLVEMPGVPSDDPRFTVTRISFTGDMLLRRAYRYNPRPLTREQRDSIHDAYAANFSNGATMAQAREAAREHVRIPAAQPPISEVMIGADDRIWLRREEVSAPRTWVVLDARGDIAMTCTAPAGVTLFAADERRAWGQWQDQLGVPYLVRLDIQQQ